MKCFIVLALLLSACTQKQTYSLEECEKIKNRDIYFPNVPAECDHFYRPAPVPSPSPRKHKPRISHNPHRPGVR